MKLLLIEDDIRLAKTLYDALRREYVVDLVYTGAKGLFRAKTSDYDLLIVDLVLPDIHGVSVCRQLRDRGRTMPILVLTAKKEIEQIVQALDSGADDYLTKPFHFPELLARVRALSRRAEQPVVPEVLTIGDLTLNRTMRTVRRRDKEINLRRKEFNLLEYLMRQHRQVVTRSMILDHVWEAGIDPFSNTVDVHINYLREKIDRPFRTTSIKTVPGIGYKLEA